MGDERVKKKIHPFGGLSIGSEGGIAGLLVFGGALAIAGFMAVTSFARDRNHAKSKSKPQQLLVEEEGCKSEQDHETTQSLNSLIQHSSTQDGDVPCCWTSNMSINRVTSSELLSSHTSILEKTDKPSDVDESPTRFHDQEIAFSDHVHPESVASSNSSIQAQELEKDEPQDGLTSSEAETETEDDDNDKLEVDMMSSDGSEMSEEDSSEGTGTASLDYNDKPIWPGELVHESGQDLNGDYSDSHVCSDSVASGYAKNEELMKVAKKATLNEKTNISMELNDQASILRNWVVPMLLLASLLFLVLLNRYPQESFYVLDESNSVMTP